MAESNISAEFVLSQRGKRLLHYDKYLCNLNKRRKYGDSYKLLWQCERRHDTACAVYVTTDDNGVVIKQPTVSHNHAISVGRAEALVVRSNILTEAERRPEAEPAALLNEFVTPAVAVSLGNEKQLKQAVQYRRKKFRLADPPTAGDVLITDQWTRTLDGSEWYLGQVTLDEDVAHIFTTEENLLAKAERE